MVPEGSGRPARVRRPSRPAVIRPGRMPGRRGRDARPPFQRVNFSAPLPLILFVVSLATSLAEPWERIPARTDGIWYQARLSETTPHDASLVLRVYAGDLEVYVESDEIYRFHDDRAAGRLLIHVIALPRGSAGQRLFIRLPPSARPPFFGGSRVVTAAQVPAAIASNAGDPLDEDLVDLIAGALVAAMGLIAMIFSAVRRRGDAGTLFHFGTFAFLYGVRLLVQSALFPLAGASMRTMEQIEWLITYVIPIPGWVLAARLIGGGWKSTLRLQVWLFVIAAPIAIASDLIRNDPGSFEPVNNVLVIAGGINILLNLIAVRNRPGTPELRIVLAGSSVFMLFALANNLASLHLLPVDDIDETPGFIIFLATLGYAAARRFARTEHEQIELEGELSAAREIQRSILPAHMPCVEGLIVDARYVPASTVAGDLYDFLQIDERRAGIVVADVSGHGIPAALVASMVKIAVSSHAALAADPAAMLAALNTTLARDVRRGFVTATYLYFDGSAVQVANAGHPAPLLLRNGVIREIGATNPLLGRFRTATYSATTIELQRGDRIIAYTDGVVEARNARGEEFGEERLHALMKHGAALAEIVTAVENWRGAEEMLMT